MQREDKSVFCPKTSTFESIQKKHMGKHTCQGAPAPPPCPVHRQWSINSHSLKGSPKACSPLKTGALSPWERNAGPNTEIYRKRYWTSSPSAWQLHIMNRKLFFAHIQLAEADRQQEHICTSPLTRSSPPSKACSSCTSGPALPFLPAE